MVLIPAETERLLFRQHVPSDKEAYCAMEMDADVRRYVGGYPRAREEAEKRFRGSLEPIKNGLGIWAIVLKDEGNYIGRGGVYPHMDGKGIAIPGEASLSLYIAKDHWQNGYATEAGEAFIRFGFDGLGLERIVAMVQVGNDASIRVMEKLGLKLTGTEVGQWRTFYHFMLERRV
jgi:RimJ/RimL family protein N-acetyltransferase